MIHRFTADTPVQIGDLTVTPFLKKHDAADPHSFTVSSSSVKVGVFTDLGIVCDQLMHHFQQCHAVFLEANYDEEMLNNGGYPYYLKQRISNGLGHLSNVQALELFNRHRSPALRHLILSHLSKINNTPELVQELFNSHKGKTEISVASRYAEMPLILVTGDNEGTVKKKAAEHQQLSLF